MSIYNLDITKEHCPMTFVKVKLQLAKLEPGDTLEVLLTEGEPLENIPRSVAEQGYRVLTTTQVKDNLFKVVIQK
jgi:TusA-related sulfurtransferase